MTFFGDVWSPPLFVRAHFSLWDLDTSARLLSLSSPQGLRSSSHSAITWRRLTLASHHLLLFFSPWPTLQTNIRRQPFFSFSYIFNGYNHTNSALPVLGGFHFPPADLSSQAALIWIDSFISSSIASETIVEIALTGDGDGSDFQFFFFRFADRSDAICLYHSSVVRFVFFPFYSNSLKRRWQGKRLFWQHVFPPLLLFY